MRKKTTILLWNNRFMLGASVSTSVPAEILEEITVPAQDIF